VNFHKSNDRNRCLRDGFTLIEAIVGISILGIGVASTVGALTKFNSIAAVSRNATGAYQVVMNQIDLFQSMSPFNPQKTNNDGTAQIPKYIEPTNNAGNLASYDMTTTPAGSPHILGYKDPTTGIVSNQTDPWPVYREPARWTYADAAARTGATGLFATDIGQLAYQSDTQTFWRLLTTAPTWQADTSGGMIVKGTLTCAVTDISTASMPNTYQAVFELGYQYLGRGPIWSPARNRWEYQVRMTTIRTSDI
jgi:prepilin-type N-terminal cleavage/methylation domain-containing protein